MKTFDHRLLHLAACLLLTVAAIRPVGGQEPNEQSSNAPVAADRPNIVFIFFDDLGYGDWSCFNGHASPTPNIDAVAATGTRFTSFYVSQAVCTASRASLLTGCYANRVGLEGALNHTSRVGINPEEQLLPELLQEAGYATGMFGKWHLGSPELFNPLDHGFDTWLGIPYSNDNTKYHPVLAAEMPPLPLYRDREVIELDPDQRLLTRRLTEASTAFIRENADGPFFLYVPHVMPHVPIFASERFTGSTGRGLYADVVRELDWSVGQIRETLQQLGLEQNTLLMITSDNGPFLSYGSHAGSNGGLREGKLTSYEGGVRVPMVARWPGKIPAGKSCKTPISAIDLLPTFCSVADTAMPDREIDGRNALALLLHPETAETPHDALYFYTGSELHAVRAGRWKLHFPHPYLTVNGETRDDGKPASWGELAPKGIEQSGVDGIASRHGYRVEQQPLALYDLQADPGETRDVSPKNPEVVQRLRELADAMRQQLGDSLAGVAGTENRPAGRK